MSAPAMGERWWAQRGGGAWAVGSAVRRRGSGAGSACRGSGRSRTPRSSTASPSTSRRSGLRRLPGPVVDAWRERGFGDFWGYALVAEGAAEAMVEVGPNPWDLAAPSVVVEEAGGRLTDSDGNGHPRRDVLATNGLLHDESWQATGVRHDISPDRGPATRGAGLA